MGAPDYQIFGWYRRLSAVDILQHKLYPITSLQVDQHLSQGQFMAIVTFGAPPPPACLASSGHGDDTRTKVGYFKPHLGVYAILAIYDPQTCSKEFLATAFGPCILGQASWTA